MKSKAAAFVIGFILLSSCAGPAPAPTPAPPPSPAPTPAGLLVVDSAADRGPGSLRQALTEAGAGAVITFDPAVFPPENPAVIRLASALPPLSKGDVTVDASNAGVILEGSSIPQEWQPAFDLVSDGNAVMGFEITDFSGPGFLIEDGADSNRIGGERSTGRGPFGQGNLIRGTSDGIALRGSENTISGNLIGTDTAGKEHWGNRAPGIFLEGGASGNIIGPDNIIAYNGAADTRAGIEFRSPNAKGNRITANNIHDNSGPAIFYEVVLTGVDAFPAPPHLLEFDMEKGLAEGIACPGCTVELFTSSEAGDDLFEGSVRAYANGAFRFEKGGHFSGRGLKATAFDPALNTSQFSIPAGERSPRLELQAGAATLRLPLPSIKHANLAFNRIGSMSQLGCSEDQYAAEYVDEALRMGYTWQRVAVEWSDWDEFHQSGQFSDFSIDSCQDKAIDLLVENGVQVLLTVTYWDPQITEYEGYRRFRTQTEIDRYLDYVRFVVGHFKGRVQWYSILNEPNHTDGQGAVLVDDYIELARQVIPVIRQTDPAAKIVIGEVTCLNRFGGLEYLERIVRSNVAAQADGIAWHLGSDHSIDYEPDFYRLYPRWVKQIVAGAQHSGFKGQFFATELHWRTAETVFNDNEAQWVYPDVISAKYYDRGMVDNLTRGFWITVGHENYLSIPEVVMVISSLTNILAGAEPGGRMVNFKNPADELRSPVFETKDGGLLVAVWRDVKASEEDQGELNDVILPGLKAGKVTGIDPLYGYRQELAFEQGENLTVPNVRIYDYPTFLLIEP